MILSAGFIFMEVSNLTNRIDSFRIVGKKGSIDQKENICFDLLLFFTTRKKGINDVF